MLVILSLKSRLQVASFVVLVVLPNTSVLDSRCGNACRAMCSR